MGNTRRSKRDKPQGLLRKHLAENIAGLRDLRYPNEKSDTAKNRLLGKHSDISPSQVQRIIKCELGTSVDQIEALARALHARPQDLLTPYFAAQFTAEPIVPIPSRPRRRA